MEGEDQGKAQEEESGEELGGKAPGEKETEMGDPSKQEASPPKGTLGQEGDGGVRVGACIHVTWASGRAYPKARTWQPVFTRTLTMFVELHLDMKEVAQLMKALVEQIWGFF